MINLKPIQELQNKVDGEKEKVAREYLELALRYNQIGEKEKSYQKLFHAVELIGKEKVKNLLPKITEELEGRDQGELKK